MKIQILYSVESKDWILDSAASLNVQLCCLELSFRLQTKCTLNDLSKFFGKTDMSGHECSHTDKTWNCVGPDVSDAD